MNGSTNSMQQWRQHQPPFTTATMSIHLAIATSQKKKISNCWLIAGNNLLAVTNKVAKKQ